MGEIARRVSILTRNFVSSGKLISIKYHDGYQQTLAYDGAGNNTTITDSFNRTLTFTYTSNGLVHTMTDADGKVTQYGYLDTGQPGSGLFVLQTVTYPDWKSIGYIYDDTRPINRFVLTGITDELGNRVATWTYDAQGRATSSQHAGGADLTTIAYDDVGNTRSINTVTGPAFTVSGAPIARGRVNVGPVTELN